MDCHNDSEDSLSKPITLSIDTDLYQAPYCLGCGHRLHKITSNGSLCSCPPYYRFECEKEGCGFHGWVMLEHSEKVKAERSECKGYKFAVTKPMITNDSWIANLKTSLADQ